MQTVHSENLAAMGQNVGGFKWRTIRNARATPTTRGGGGGPASSGKKNCWVEIKLGKKRKEKPLSLPLRWTPFQSRPVEWRSVGGEGGSGPAKVATGLDPQGRRKARPRSCISNRPPPPRPPDPPGTGQGCWGSREFHRTPATRCFRVIAGAPLGRNQPASRLWNSR